MGGKQANQHESPARRAGIIPSIIVRQWSVLANLRHHNEEQRTIPVEAFISLSAQLIWTAYTCPCITSRIGVRFHLSSGVRTRLVSMRERCRWSHDRNSFSAFKMSAWAMELRRQVFVERCCDAFSFMEVPVNVSSRPSSNSLMSFAWAGRTEWKR